MKKDKIYHILIMICCLCFPMISFAQGPVDPCDPGPCPIDGGLSLLIAAGVGYGVKKYRDGRRKMGRG